IPPSHSWLPPATLVSLLKGGREALRGCRVGLDQDCEVLECRCVCPHQLSDAVRPITLALVYLLSRLAFPSNTGLPNLLCGFGMESIDVVSHHSKVTRLNLDHELHHLPRPLARRVGQSMLLCNQLIDAARSLLPKRLVVAVEHVG